MNNDTYSRGVHMKVIKLGMVGGSGQHATENLLPAIAMCKNVILSYVCSRDTSTALRLAREWGAGDHTNDWRQLVNAPSVDAVVVSSEPDVHKEVAIATLKNNKYVYIEKPPTATLEDLDNLIKIEAKSGGKAFVGFNFDYGSSYRCLRKTIEQQDKIKVARLRFVGKRPHEKMWSYKTIIESHLYAVAIHAIDLVVRLFGEPVKTNAELIKLDDTYFLLNVIIQFKSGGIAELDLGNYANSFEYEIELIGESRTRGILRQHNRLTFYPNRKGQNYFINSKEATEFDWPSLEGGYERTGYLGAVENFADSVRARSQVSSTLSTCRTSYSIIVEIIKNIQNIF